MANNLIHKRKCNFDAIYMDDMTGDPPFLEEDARKPMISVEYVEDEKSI